MQAKIVMNCDPKCCFNFDIQSFVLSQAIGLGVIERY